MMDYGSHRALYIACSGTDALMLNWRKEGRLVLVFSVRADPSFPKSNELILLQDSKKVIKFTGNVYFCHYAF